MCFILTFLIVEIHIPTQTQNAVFLTALRHFSSHPRLTDATESLSIHTSPSPPRAQSPHQQGSRHFSDGCGSVQRKGCGGSPLLRSLDGCTFCWWHWLSCPPSHCALVRGGVHTLLLVASRGRKWRRGLEEDVEILTERVLILLVHHRIAQLLIRLRESRLDGLSLLALPWPLFRWPQHLTHHSPCFLLLAFYIHSGYLLSTSLPCSSFWILARAISNPADYETHQHQDHIPSLRLSLKPQGTLK